MPGNRVGAGTSERSESESQVAGRLTLSWANKDKALLSHGASGYEWVQRDDPRANEVRLLGEVSLVGDAAGTPGDNLLIRGDSLDALRALVRTPEYAEVYRGKVKLVYIDPPFNTGQAFEHYDDSLEHSVWLGMMRERLVLIRELLAPDGAVWVHLDDVEMAYCKVLMDEIFGRANSVATVVWEKADSPRNSARFLSVDQDYVLIYARSAEAWVPSKLERSEAINAKYKNPDNDERGPWYGDNLRANKPYSLGRYTVIGPTGNKFEAPPGKYWRISKERFDELDKDGQIYWGAKRSAFPTIKRYLSEVGDMVPRTFWPNVETGSNRTSSNEMKALFPGVETFATPKPERLLERVIHIGSNPGDIVLDCFARSGTTAAVAHKMGRRWVTVELSESTTSTFTKPRLEKVLNGEDPGGITKSVGWNGGGGFRELRIASPTYAPLPPELGSGTVIAANLPAGQLQRSVAAQLGYTLLDDSSGDSSGVFTGARGRSRLTVIDGVADEVVIGDVLAALEYGQTALIAATAFTPGAQPALREASRGSRCVRIPGDLFGAGGAVIR